MTTPSYRRIGPREIRIEGATPIDRTVHQDPRGFLVETMRRDDAAIRGERFSLAYSSLTLPGKFRDVDRWHVHRVQTDRFVVPLGSMTLALYDGRPGSATHGRLEVIEMRGRPFRVDGESTASTSTISLVPIPPGVYHVIGNLSPDPFLLQNFPTELYDPGDEGRVPFADVGIGSPPAPFAWDRVDRGSRPGA